LDQDQSLHGLSRHSFLSWVKISGQLKFGKALKYRLTEAVQIFFFGKLTYVLKEEDTNIIRGIPQIYNDNRNIKQQMATG